MSDDDNFLANAEEDEDLQEVDGDEDMDEDEDLDMEGGDDEKRSTSGGGKKRRVPFEEQQAQLRGTSSRVTVAGMPVLANSYDIYAFVKPVAKPELVFCNTKGVRKTFQVTLGSPAEAAKVVDSLNGKQMKETDAYPVRVHFAREREEKEGAGGTDLRLVVCENVDPLATEGDFADKLTKAGLSGDAFMVVLSAHYKDGTKLIAKIVCKDAGTALKAQRALHLKKLKSCPLYCGLRKGTHPEDSERRKTELAGTTKCITVNYVHYKAKEDNLRTLALKYGTVERVNFRKNNGYFNNTVLITFTDPEAAKRAYEGIDGKKANGLKLLCSYAEERMRSGGGSRRGFSSRGRGRGRGDGRGRSRGRSRGRGGYSGYSGHSGRDDSNGYRNGSRGRGGPRFRGSRGRGRGSDRGGGRGFRSRSRGRGGFRGGVKSY